MGENKTSISQADTLEKVGEFWDSHDFTDYDTDAPDADFKIRCAVRVDSEILTMLEKQARQRGVRVETLVNLWLQQKLMETVPSAV